VRAATTGMAGDATWIAGRHSLQLE